MKKRMVLMLLVIAVFLTAIGAVKYGQIKKGMAQQANFQMPPEAVTTVVAKKQEWAATLSAIGSVAAVHGVDRDRGPAGRRREDLVRIRQDGAPGRCARPARHAAGSRRSSPRRRRSASSPS